MKKIPILVISLLLLSNCMSIIESSVDSSMGIEYETIKVSDNLQYKVQIEFKDDIENPYYYVKMKDIVLDSSGYPEGDEDFSLSYYAFKNESPGDYYSLVLSIGYVGNDWRFMKGNIEIKLNEEVISFVDYNPYTSFLRSGNVLETLSTDIDGDTVNKILSNDSMIIQYYHSPIRLSSTAFKAIKDFISRFYGKTFFELKVLDEIKKHLKEVR